MSGTFIRRTAVTTTLLEALSEKINEERGVLLSVDILDKAFQKTHQDELQIESNGNTLTKAILEIVDSIEDKEAKEEIQSFLYEAFIKKVVSSGAYSSLLIHGFVMILNPKIHENTGSAIKSMISTLGVDKFRKTLNLPEEAREDIEAYLKHLTPEGDKS